MVLEVPFDVTAGTVEIYLEHYYHSVIEGLLLF